MADHPMTCAVRDWYNDVNTNKQDLDPTRLNEEDLHPDHVRVFGELSDFTKRQYVGTGMFIPEKLEGKRVLDLGCGAGSLVFVLSKLVGPEGFVVGVDLSDGYIATAKAESEYHWKKWGYDKANFEFFVGNAERLDELGLQPNSFDLLVSNGLFCLVPDKESAYHQAFNVLKEGGQFCVNDVVVNKEVPSELRNDPKLYSEGLAASLRWDQVTDMAAKVGFTAPYLTQTNPVGVDNEQYKALLGDRRYVAAGFRLFKLPKGAKRGASQVTYKGNIPGFPEAFRWNVDLTFKAGVGVDVDSDLATVLSFSYFSDNFDFADFIDSPTTKRNQDPFVRLDMLRKEGCTPDFIYKLE